MNETKFVMAFVFYYFLQFNKLARMIQLGSMHFSDYVLGKQLIRKDAIQ